MAKKSKKAKKAEAHSGPPVVHTITMSVSGDTLVFDQSPPDTEPGGPNPPTNGESVRVDPGDTVIWKSDDGNFSAVFTDDSPLDDFSFGGEGGGHSRAGLVKHKSKKHYKYFAAVATGAGVKQKDPDIVIT